MLSRYSLQTFDSYTILSSNSKTGTKPIGLRARNQSGFCFKLMLTVSNLEIQNENRQSLSENNINVFDIRVLIIVSV